MELNHPTNHQNKEPWSLSRFPRYENALSLDSINAEELTEEEFRRNYVEKNRPCLLKGAVKHWPAYRQWSSTAYLKEKTRNEKTFARSYPISEYIFEAKGALKQQLIEKNQAVTQEIMFHEFLDRVENENESGQLVIHSWPLQQGLALSELCSDIDSFPFLPKPGGSRFYPSYRAFFYRQSYTDWHYHPTDEALMTQVVGAKEVLLLPPDKHSWDALWPVARQKGYLFDIDTNQFPKIRDMHPYRVTVEAGDALYIPVFWWHAVESLDEKFGITVAATFQTPLHINGDLQYPAARELFRNAIITSRAPLIIGATAYSLSHKMVKKLAHLIS
jgi:hypothetical protein